MFGKKQPVPNCIPGEGILDITDLNQNTPGDVTLNIEISKQPTPNVTDLNQNIPDHVTPNIEIPKQPTPNSIPGEGILDITDLNQNIPNDVMPNIEISKHSQNNNLENLNTELSDQKNSKKITTPLTPPNDKENK